MLAIVIMNVHVSDCYWDVIVIVIAIVIVIVVARMIRL